MTAAANDVEYFASRPFALLRLAHEQFTNPRTFSGLEPSDVREFAIDIFGRGILSPLLVTEDNLVIGGSRRYRALDLLSRCQNVVGLREELATVLGLSYGGPALAAIDERISGLLAAVPVAIVSGSVGDREGLARLEGVALADNVHRVELSSYEVAARLTILHHKGATGAQLARLIGKSPSYVSRKLSTWRNAGVELKAAWKGGMAEDAVIVLSQLPHDEQARALAGPIPRGRRGPAHRPSVDTVRETLDALQKRAGHDAGRLWALEAMRWVLGETTSPEFASWLREVET